MKNNRGKGLLCLLISIAAIVLFGYLGYTTANDIKLGLDLAGGVSITYQAVGDVREVYPDIEIVTKEID